MDEENEAQPVPPNYNQNIFKVYFYHFERNRFHDCLRDYGSFRNPGKY